MNGAGLHWASRIGALGLVLVAVVFGAREVVSRPRAAPRMAIPGSTPPPNILLVSIDTLRADHLGAYGYERETSPNLDALAAEGARFAQAISPTAWTLPAHVTLLTSLPPERHGVIASNLGLREGVPTLAEALAAVGYETAGFVSGPYLRSIYGYARGFATYDENEVRPRGVPSQEAVTSPGLTERVIAWLEEWSKRGTRRPFFVFLHIWDVHDHYAPPPPYDEMFDPDYEGSMHSSADFPWSTPIEEVPARELEHLIALYDGEIRFVDDHLGRIFDELRRLGVWDQTIVAVTSDHGEEFYEHASAGHSRSLFDGLVHVPLIMRHPPRIPPGLVVERQVRLMDLGPTLLGLTGLPEALPLGRRHANPAHVARDLTPWLVGARPLDSFPDLPAFLETSIWGNRQGGLRTNDFKLVHSFEAKNGGRVVRRRLFRFSDDPSEDVDLVAIDAEPSESWMLEDRLKTWAELWDEEQESEPISLEPKHVQMLRALGYVE